MQIAAVDLWPRFLEELRGAMRLDEAQAAVELIAFLSKELR